jgi:hypothetical protein
VSFSDAPLTNLVITATAQASDASNANGATQSTIVCNTADAQGNYTSSGAGIGSNGPANPASVSDTGTSGLTPGTYYCKVVVDP